MERKRRRKGAGPPTKMLRLVKTTLDQEESDYEEMQRRYGRGWQQVARDLIAAHLATEATVAQPIQGALLQEAGWVKSKYNGGYTYEMEFYNEYEESGRVHIDKSDNHKKAYVYLIFNVDDGIDDGVRRFCIPIPNIKTMASLNRLLRGLKGD